MKYWFYVSYLISVRQLTRNTDGQPGNDGHNLKKQYKKTIRTIFLSHFKAHISPYQDVYSIDDEVMVDTMWHINLFDVKHISKSFCKNIGIQESRNA